MNSFAVKFRGFSRKCTSFSTSKIAECSYSINIFQKKDLDECVRLLAHNFVLYDPICKGLNWSADEFAPIVEHVLLNSVDSGVSVVARDKRSGQIVACQANQDCADDADSDYSKISPKFKPHIALTYELCEGSDYQSFKKGECVAMCFAAVAKEMTRQNIFSVLFHENLRIVAEKGYTKAMAECTNSTSRRGAEREGFKLEKYISYQDFSFEGTKPFSSVEGGSCLMTHYNLQSFLS